jgi:lipopolysaccharide biosynthesis glycosyltransferase
MKNCLCLRLWNDDRYINALYTQLESIYMFGNLDNNTDIIIYVSEEYKNKIIDNNLINDKVKIEIFDFRKVKYNKLLLSQLDLPILQNYDKVLYLDIYSIINDDISRLFDTINNDEIYTNGPDDGNISTPIAFLLYRNNETTRTFFDRV